MVCDVYDEKQYRVQDCGDTVAGDELGAYVREKFGELEKEWKRSKIRQKVSTKSQF